MAMQGSTLSWVEFVFKTHILPFGYLAVLLWLQIEQSGVAKLDYMYNIFTGVLDSRGDDDSPELDQTERAVLTSKLNEYFLLSEIPKTNPPEAIIQMNPRKLLSADMKVSVNISHTCIHHSLQLPVYYWILV